MKEFQTLKEMIETYRDEYNAGYGDAVKHFTGQEVLEHCVYTLDPKAAKVLYGIEISRSTQYIENFGYVRPVK